MRVWWVLLVTGCGFEVHMTGEGPPIQDAPLGDTPVADMAIDAPIDAMWTADDCPMTYQTVGTLGSRYLLRTQNMTVKEHHALCMADGTHLAVIDSTTEAAALRQLVDGTTFSGNAFGFVWIGVAQRNNQVSVGSGWVNATGGAFDPQYWDSGEPNDGANVEDGEEQFAAIRKNRNLVADIREEGDVAALCECDGKAITPEYKDLIDD